MLGNRNAKKDGLIDDDIIEYKQKESGKDGKNKDRTNTSRVSLRDGKIWGERRSDGGGNGGEHEHGSNGGESVLNISQSGIGLGERGLDERVRPGRGIPGRRLTKGEIKDIRKQVKEMLANKKDEEFTEADTALLRQYGGAGGLGEEGTSTSGTFYEYYTPDSITDVFGAEYKPYGEVIRKDLRVALPSVEIAFNSGDIDEKAYKHVQELLKRIG